MVEVYDRGFHLRTESCIYGAQEHSLDKGDIELNVGWIDWSDVRARKKRYEQLSLR